MIGKMVLLMKRTGAYANSGWLGPAALCHLDCLPDLGYRDFDWHSELPRLKHIHWMWICLQPPRTFLSMSSAVRWNMLLSPMRRSSRRSVQAIYIGLSPMSSSFAKRRSHPRYLQSHWSEYRSLHVSSALIERLFDGLWLIADSTSPRSL